MLARRLRLAALLRGGAPPAAAAQAPSAPVDVMPLREVRPGMEGVGRTVFEGATIESFAVRVLGVLENAVGPRRSLVLARLEGGPLARTGVIAGMSGSPVFIGGRLLGAVSYAFPFGKEPIAGITPIGDMLEAGSRSRRAPRAAVDAAAPARRVARRAARRRGRRRRRSGGRCPRSSRAAFRGEALPAGLAGADLQPLALPLVFSGFDADAFAWARGVFQAMGFAPVMGGGGGGVEPRPGRTRSSPAPRSASRSSRATSTSR